MEFPLHRWEPAKDAERGSGQQKIGEDEPEGRRVSGQARRVPGTVPQAPHASTLHIPARIVSGDPEGLGSSAETLQFWGAVPLTGGGALRELPGQNRRAGVEPELIPLNPGERWFRWSIVSLVGRNRLSSGRKQIVCKETQAASKASRHFPATVGFRLLHTHQSAVVGHSHLVQCMESAWILHD